MPAFAEEMQYEQKAMLDPLLHAALGHLFPNASGMRRERSYAGQMAGIDVHILDVTLDFKFRRRTYADFALEYLHEHDDGRARAGWVAQDKACDFIAYVFQKPVLSCHLIPFAGLRAAWSANGPAWCSRYRDARRHRSRNAGYWTLFCPVPRAVLRQAVAGIRAADPLGLMDWESGDNADNQFTFFGDSQTV